MKSNMITGVQELHLVLLNSEINFFNISKLFETIIHGERCNGCNKVSLFKSDMLIKKVCGVVSSVIYILKSATETLLSSSCVEEEKIILTKKIRFLAYEIKIFLLTCSPVISSNSLGEKVMCQCNNHKNIDSLIKIFINVIDIK